MAKLLHLSAKAYAAILPLYPPELRRDFGQDMQDAFTEDLSEASKRRGVPGIARVWTCTLRELLRIALPVHFHNPAIAVPCTTFAFCQAFMNAELLTGRMDPRMASHHFPPLEMIPLVALGPSLFSALIAFLVVIAGNRSLPTRLNLSAR